MTLSTVVIDNFVQYERILLNNIRLVAVVDHAHGKSTIAPLKIINAKMYHLFIKITNEHII